MLLRTRLQRVSAVAFLAAFVVQAHFVAPRTAPLAWKSVTLVMLLAGVVHTAVGLQVVVTDYRALARLRGALNALIVLAAGALFVAGAAAVLRARTRPIAAGHFAGTRCARCHDSVHARWPLSQHAAGGARPEYAEPALVCAQCHDVTLDTPDLLAFWNTRARRYEPQQSRQALCARCHFVVPDERAAGAPDAVHAGVRCVECHAVPASRAGLAATGSCARCHPIAGDPHTDVTREDTSYRATDSAHDVHSLTCTTCHAASARRPPW